MNTVMEDRLVIAACARDARLRVDLFLAAKLAMYSRSAIAKFIKTGAITNEEGLMVKPSQLIVGDEHFVFTVPKVAPATMVAEDIFLDVLYSDEYIAVINKPVGLVTHPGAGVKNGTLCNALLFHFPGMSVGTTERPGIVHRLDKDTSGVIVVAKTEMAHRALSDAFRQRQVEKYYLAICYGEFFERAFALKTGHARHPHNRLRFTTKLSVASCHGQKVRMAHTHFTVMQSSFGLSLVTAQLHTGRTHQIRAHLADIDRPLVGDELYGGKRILSSRLPEELRVAINNLKGQALHAETLIFHHPVTKELLKFVAPVPDHIALIMRFF